MKAKELLSFWRPLIEDAGHSWSIGTFGASAEFHRTPEEKCQIIDAADSLAAVTDKGAIRVEARGDLDVIAFDNLNSDGETWSHSVVFCAPFVKQAPGTVTPLGKDSAAIREEDRDAMLFDVGVGLGLVRMCVRTKDAALIAALDERAGKPLFGPDNGDVMHALFRAQPHRVMLSPAARIEVYQDIPQPDGDSPEGPHTHLLPKLLSKQMTHSANTPIPDGLQSVLNLHPRSPWRDGLGKRTPYNAKADAAFEALLANHALADDREVRRSVEKAVAKGVAPTEFRWPETRRGRTQARIALRRLGAAKNDPRLAAWRSAYDRAPVEEQDEEQDAAHPAS